MANSPYDGGSGGPRGIAVGEKDPTRHPSVRRNKRKRVSTPVEPNVKLKRQLSSVAKQYNNHMNGSNAKKRAAMHNAIKTRRSLLSNLRNTKGSGSQHRENVASNINTRIKYYKKTGNEKGLKRASARQDRFQTRMKHRGEHGITQGQWYEKAGKAHERQMQRGPRNNELERVLKEGKRQQRPGNRSHLPNWAPHGGVVGPINLNRRNMRNVVRSQPIGNPVIKKRNRYQTPPTKPITRY